LLSKKLVSTFHEEIMNTFSPIPTPTNFAHEIQMLRDKWCWFLALGIAMVLFGTVAIGQAVVATKAATVLFGILLLAGGVAEIISSFWAGKWSATLVHLLIGVLYTVVGLIIIDTPMESAVQLTLIIALFLIFGGIFRVVFALSERFTGWGWVMLNGAVSLLLGVLIYKQWPYSGLWIIGLFVGIELIFNGWAWIMLSLGLKNSLPASTPQTT
jgi:uncharacterized membrane protein HdeD (DUF308 family)